MFARVAVGSLVLHEAGGYILPPPGPQTGRYIAKIVAGGNQGNRTRNRQVLSKIYRVGFGRKEALEWKTVETEGTVQRNGPFYAGFRKTLSLCNANGTDRWDTYNNYYNYIIFQLRPQKPIPLSIIGGALL